MEVVLACDTFGFPADVAEVPWPPRKGITMSELRDRMIQDMQLAGLFLGLFVSTSLTSRFIWPLLAIAERELQMSNIRTARTNE